MDADRDTVFELVTGEAADSTRPARSPPAIESHGNSKSRVNDAHAKTGLYPLVKPKVPRECDPDRDYEFIYEMEPGDGRGYCLASSKHDNSIVIVRRNTNRAVFELERNEPYALNLIDAIRWNKSTFSVHAYPGIALADVVWMSHTAFRDFRIICKETIRGLESLNRVGCYFQELSERDIFISERDGRIKLAYDRNVHIGPYEPPPQAQILVQMLSRVLESIDARDNAALEFMRTGKKALKLGDLKQHPFIVNALDLKWNQLSALAIRTAALSFQGLVRPTGLLKDMVEDDINVGDALCD